jgi:hypothetical protein
VTEIAARNIEEPVRELYRLIETSGKRCGSDPGESASGSVVVKGPMGLVPQLPASTCWRLA